jgi:putative DNA primase/helicase
MGTDDGIWRRMLLIPFTESIPIEEQDPNLKNKLLKELSGILNWLLEGYVKWQTEGLRIPECVKHSSLEYRGEMNKVLAFIDECCVVGEDFKEKYKDVYECYRKWDNKPIGRGVFKKRLQEQGFTVKAEGANVLTIFCLELLSAYKPYGYTEVKEPDLF